MKLLLLLLCNICLANVLTIRQVLDGLPDATVEGTGVRRTLERQAALLVVHPPVMERWSGFSVDQVLLQEALEDHLRTEHQHSVSLSLYLCQHLTTDHHQICLGWVSPCNII